MSEFRPERRLNRALKIVAISAVALAIPACSKGTEASNTGNSTSTATTVDAPPVFYPEEVWGSSYVDVLGNATVDCDLAREHALSGEDSYSDYLSSRPWFISGTGKYEKGYQSGGFAGNGSRMPDDSTIIGLSSGFYIHRGAKDHFGVYESTSDSRSVEYTGYTIEERKFQYIESFNLTDMGQNSSKVYQNDDVAVVLTHTDELPHYYDASYDRMFRYPSAYPQGVSGIEEAPGLAIEVMCNTPGVTPLGPPEAPEAIESIL